MLPYGKQTIEADDIRAVLRTLESDWLTTGPAVEQFEECFARAVGARHAVAVSSGTAALHSAMVAAGINSNDEVIVPAISFVATANAVVYCGGKPVFADVDPETLLIDPVDVIKKITDKTKAIVTMDYAGQPCDYDVLRRIANQHELTLIADACHSLGGKDDDRAVGTFADLNCFSLHPVKPITAGEGGVITTDNAEFARAMKVFRNHGISDDFRSREKTASHSYAMSTLGFNYRLTDIQCALAASQLKKLNRFTDRRNEIASRYDDLLADHRHVTPLSKRNSVRHAYHLYVVRWNETKSGLNRDEAFQRLRSQEIGVNVHFEPIYRHPYYREPLGCVDHRCPMADQVYSEILSLPIFPSMTLFDIHRVVREISRIIDRDQKPGIRSLA